MGCSPAVRGAVCGFGKYPAEQHDRRYGSPYLTNSFISIPLISAPGVFKVKDPTHEKTAKSYRPNFLLSYAFVILRSIVPNSSINKIDALARQYTSYGPAPLTLIPELTS